MHASRPVVALATCAALPEGDEDARALAAALAEPGDRCPSGRVG